MNLNGGREGDTKPLVTITVSPRESIKTGPFTKSCEKVVPFCISSRERERNKKIRKRMEKDIVTITIAYRYTAKLWFVYKRALRHDACHITREI